MQTTVETKEIAALAPRFHTLFDGYDQAYGYYNGLTEKRPDGKILGTSRGFLRGAVTIELWEKHLTGKSGLGVVPIRSDSTVRFGAIDVDEYHNTDHQAIAQRCEKLKLPLIPCRSKSGGCHLYCFTRAPIPAALMVSKLREMAALIGFGNVEHFPKQTAILDNGKDCGSFINVPYFDDQKGLRWAVKPDGEAMTAVEFLDYAESIQQEQKWFEKPLLVSSELPQGPPCLQHLVTLGFPPGTRNNGLYNLGVYCRKADEDNWKPLVEEMNRKYMQPPLDADEVLAITKSLAKKAYSYKCSDQPIASHCNAALCRSRKFGVGNQNRLPELGGLSKLGTGAQTIWYLTVQGKRLELKTRELQDPVQFQQKCMEYLSIMPAIPKHDVWQAAISDAMEHIVEIEMPEDATVLGRFRLHLQKFCTGRAQAMSMEEVTLGRAFDDGTYVWFTLEDVISHLERVRFREVPTGEVHLRVKDLGGMAAGRRRLKGVQVSLWKIPSFERQTQAFDVPRSIAEEEKPF